MKEVFAKYKSIITYGIFGVLTTVINIVCYQVLYSQVHLSNVESNIIAWVIAVTFAYVTNKIWVFESKSLEPKVLFAEIWKFVTCRLATGALDLVIMYIGVDLMHGPSMILKIVSNVIVILLNYVASKIIIFKKEK